MVIADPSLRPVYVLNSDVIDGFYRIALQSADGPKIGLVFPFDEQREDKSAILFTFPMGCKHSPPIFCMTTEKVMDLANTALRSNKLY